MNEFPEIDTKTLHGRTVTLQVKEESGYLILYGVDEFNKEIYLLSIEKDDEK